MILQGLVGILVTVLLALLAPDNIAHANLVKNPGFETGDFGGWTRSGNSGFTSVTSSSFYVNSGTFGASLGPIGSDGILSQTLPTTPGTAYIVSFALRSDGLFTNDFSAAWGGQTFFSRVNMPNAGWMPLSFTEVATGSSTTLQLAFRDDPGFLGLDDVAVNATPQSTPEPTTVLLLSTTIAGLGLAWRRRLAGGLPRGRRSRRRPRSSGAVGSGAMMPPRATVEAASAPPPQPAHPRPLVVMTCRQVIDPL